MNELMNEITPYILGVLLAVVLVLTFFLVFFLIRWRKDKRRLLKESDRKCEEIKREMTEHAENRYKAGKQDAVDVIRTTIDTIQNNKEEFEKMDEKNLLVETMLALGSYARRLDRIEEKMKIISNYNIYIESMNQAMQELRGNLDNQRREIDDIDSFVKRFSSDSQRITNTVEQVNDRLADAASINSRTEEIITKLRISTTELDNINDRVNDISGKMDGFFYSYSESPMVVIHSIKDKADKTISLVDDLNSKLADLEYGMMESMEDIQSTANGNAESIETIDELVRGLRRDIETMDSDVDDISSDIEDLSSDIEEVKSTVDRSFNSYSSDSVYDKIDDLQRDIDAIESSINDIDYKLNNIDSKLS